MKYSAPLPCHRHPGISLSRGNSRIHTNDQDYRKSQRPVVSRRDLQPLCILVHTQYKSSESLSLVVHGTLQAPRQCVIDTRHSLRTYCFDPTREQWTKLRAKYFTNVGC